MQKGRSQLVSPFLLFIYNKTHMQHSGKSKEKWIINGTVVTQDSQRRVLRTNLRLIDGHIVELTNRKPGGRALHAEVIDATGLTILPGFVQAHIHLCQTLFRNQADDLELMDWLAKRIWRMEAAHDEESLNTSALLGIHELLSSGTTCILDMGTVRHTEAIFDAVKTSGIRANVGKCLMDHPKRTPPNLREPTHLALREAKDLYSKWNGAANGRIRASYAPRFVISCTEELMRAVAQLSQEQCAVVHTHASENRKEIELVRKFAGCANVEYLRRLGLTTDRLVLAHGIWLSRREVEILRKSGTSIVHCPSSNLKLASGIARVPELRRLGINVALGADGAPCNNNLNAFQEMRLAALLHKPAGGPRTMRAREVLDMATRDGARALKWFDEIGSIEKGKKADLVALDLNCPENTLPAPAVVARRPDLDAIASAIVYSSQPSHVRWTMVEGQLLYRNGRVRTIETTALMARVYRAQLAIAARVKRQR